MPAPAHPASRAAARAAAAPAATRPAARTGSSRANRVRIHALRTPGWLDAQLLRRRYVTAATLLGFLFAAPAFAALVAGGFSASGRGAVHALNGALWGQSTLTMLVAAVALVATVLIPTVIASRRESVFGDGLSEHLELVGAIASAATAACAVGLGWVRLLAIVHAPPGDSHLVGIIAESMLAFALGGLASLLFAANRIQLGTVRETLDRDRRALAELRAIDARLRTADRADAERRRPRLLRAWWFATAAAALITFVVLALHDSVLGPAAVVVALLVVQLPIWHTNFGRFAVPNRARTTWFWVGMVFLTLLLQLGIELELVVENLPIWPSWLLPFLQIGAPVALWLWFERLLARRLGLPQRVSLQLERQRRMLSGQMASLELSIARHELLERRLHAGIRLPR